MNKRQLRQLQLLEILKAQGTGVVNMCNDQLAYMLSVSDKTVQKDITEMTNKSIIVKETTLILVNGSTRRQRDITIPGEVQRRFTLGQHKQLSSRSNHRIYTNEWDEVIWDRCIDSKWERCMVDKEFRDEKQAYHWLYSTLSSHYRKYTNGESYRGRDQQ